MDNNQPESQKTHSRQFEQDKAEDRRVKMAVDAKQDPAAWRRRPAIEHFSENLARLCSAAIFLKSTFLIVNMAF